jgi:hypothetical protein
MAKGAKVFSQVRIGAPATEAEDAERGHAPGAPRGDERARAAAYLDLWERQLTRLAVRGLESAAPWPPA